MRSSGDPSQAHGREMGEGCTFPTWAFLNVKFGFIVEGRNRFRAVRQLETGLHEILWVMNLGSGTTINMGCG